MTQVWTDTDRPMQVTERLRAIVTGDGPRTVVLANGLGLSCQSWSTIIPHLPTDVRLIRFEYVGNPGTPSTAWNPKRYEQLYGHADDVVAMLRELAVDQAIFIGHSLSGMIGVLVHIVAPDTIGHLIMLGASPRYINDGDYIGGFSSEEVETMITRADESLEQWISGFAPLALGDSATPVLVRDYVAHFRSLRPDVARQMIASIFRSDFRHLLPRVRCTVDIVQSEHDAAVPQAVAEYLAAAIPRARLHVLPVAGHVPHLTHSTVVGPLLRRLVMTS